MNRLVHVWALRVFGLLPRPLSTLVVRLRYPTFTVGTAVAITDGAARVLLVSHTYSEGWGLPGGLLDNKEVPAQTARREIREELDLDVEVGLHPIAVRTPWKRHFTMLFTATVERTDVSTMRGHTPEIADVGWFDLDALPELSEFTALFLDAVGLRPSKA